MNKFIALALVIANVAFAPMALASERAPSGPSNSNGSHSGAHGGQSGRNSGISDGGSSRPVQDGGRAINKDPGSSTQVPGRSFISGGRSLSPAPGSRGSSDRLISIEAFPQKPDTDNPDTDNPDTDTPDGDDDDNDGNNGGGGGGKKKNKVLTVNDLSPELRAQLLNLINLILALRAAQFPFVTGFMSPVIPEVKG